MNMKQIISFIINILKKILSSVIFLNKFINETSHYKEAKLKNNEVLIPNLELMWISDYSGKMERT